MRSGEILRHVTTRHHLDRTSNVSSCSSASPQSSQCSAPACHDWSRQTSRSNALCVVERGLGWTDDHHHHHRVARASVRWFGAAVLRRRERPRQQLARRRAGQQDLLDPTTRATIARRLTPAPRPPRSSRRRRLKYRAAGARRQPRRQTDRRRATRLELECHLALADEVAQPLHVEHDLGDTEGGGGGEGIARLRLPKQHNPQNNKIGRAAWKERG